MDERVRVGAEGSCTLQFLKADRRQEPQSKARICWQRGCGMEELGRQSRLEVTAEAGALGRYQKPIWTAGLQYVVLPWITPWERSQAGGFGPGTKLFIRKTIHSWTKCLSWVSLMVTVTNGGFGGGGGPDIKTGGWLVGWLVG